METQYITNSVPAVMQGLMRKIGIENIEGLFEDFAVMPQRFDLPGPMTEYELRRYIAAILSKKSHDLLVF